MKFTLRNALFAAALAVIACFAGYYLYYVVLPAQRVADAEAVVTGFGAQLQNVAILSPDASSTMATAYAPYIDPALLQAWQKDPANAPGRVVSSPWPDHIEVVSVTPQGQGYLMQAAIIFMTSQEVAYGGNAGFAPVMVQVVPEQGGWRIAAFQSQATSTPGH